MSASFANDIAHLFNSRDLSCMARLGVHLDDYSYMSDPSSDGAFADHANARDVYAHLTGDKEPRMPLGGPYWSAAQLQLYAQWMMDGFLA
jgi:hypothetical protein